MPYPPLKATQVRYDTSMRHLTELMDAAQKVIDVMDKRLDTEPWPVKYRAPFGELTELRNLLTRLRGAR